MSRHVLLNNIDHKALRINTSRSAAFGDNVMCCVVYPVEFQALQEEYPIVFHRNAETAEVHPVALFGLEQNENLFLANEQWQASYIPLLMQRDPFLIGQQSSTKDGESQLVIHIDLDSPRVSETEGQAIFLPHGGNSEFIEQIASVLKAIHFSQPDSKAFTDALKQHDLLEPIVLDIELGKNRHHRLSGFHTINEKALANLNDQAIVALHRKGFLAWIYCCQLSLGRLNALVRRKQQQ
ncbi:SapC family protein [Permianibacter aggregans]|uniref:SapC protein n=1 Tax=Permianibacter aggregans TaxID=1510150 RepID=A0A4R6UYF8_9GAMM|nr:SapC family protein [Permianibacter aggregans]QGX41545.1 multidrug transporter [Permianibacter aggregans]TDQ51346.1 SapC protein [Permianibacter aggregans]